MFKTDRYLTRHGRATLRLMRKFLSDPHEPHYAYELSRACRIRSGRLYPLLRRMEDMGWLEGEWEESPPRPDRPKRMIYRSTTEGRAAFGQVEYGVWKLCRMDVLHEVRAGKWL